MSFEQKLKDAKVVPVIAVRDTDQAVNIADALLAGGVNVLEITLRTPAGLDAIAAVRKAFPDMLVGCGTVRHFADVRQAVAAGSQFLVSPGTPDQLADAMAASGLACLPGAGTISEMLSLYHKGFTLQKFFPAQASGGTAYLQAIKSVLPEVKFCPTGGVSAANLDHYLACSNVLCVGGSWLVPQADVDAGHWAAITQRAESLATL